MKYLAISGALLLGACAGFDTKQEFLQDQENMEKAMELSSMRVKSPDCEKIGQLYKFTKLEAPTTNDLANILPLLGLYPQDVSDIDKLYNIDYMIVDKYKCNDNSAEIVSKSEQYCRDKYYDEYDLETLFYFPFRLVSFVSVMTIVGAIPFAAHPCGLDSSMHPIMCKKEQDCEYYLKKGISDNYYGNIKIESLKQVLKEKIQGMLPEIPKEAKMFLPEFKFSEILKANNTILGKYDRNYCGDLCDDDTKNVTGLNAVLVLYSLCNHEHWDQVSECECFAHQTYNKVSYKNLLYIYEKNELPKSKQSEFNQTLKKCEQKIDRQRIKAEQERYGESEPTDNSSEVLADFVIDTVGNAAWAHKTITDFRKEAEKKKY